jgi:hypothetical protein
MAIVMDNDSNNDTMIEAIENQCCIAGIKFSAKQARMHSMPHSIHLAAIKASLLFAAQKYVHPYSF